MPSINCLASLALLPPRSSAKRSASRSSSSAGIPIPFFSAKWCTICKQVFLFCFEKVIWIPKRSESETSSCIVSLRWICTHVAYTEHPMHQSAFRWTAQKGEDTTFTYRFAPPIGSLKCVIVVTILHHSFYDYSIIKILPLYAGCPWYPKMKPIFEFLIKGLVFSLTILYNKTQH